MPEVKEEEKKRTRRWPRQRVRCPYCWEGLRVTDNDVPDSVIRRHLGECWRYARENKENIVA